MDTLLPHGTVISYLNLFKSNLDDKHPRKKAKILLPVEGVAWWAESDGGKSAYRIAKYTEH